MKSLFFSNFAYAASQFFLVFFISKYYGSEYLLLYGVVTGFMAPVLAFLGAGQRLKILGGKNKAGDVCDSFYIRIFFVFLSVLLLFYYASEKLLNGNALQLFLIVLYRFFDSIGELLYFWYVKEKKSKWIFIISASRIFPVFFLCLLISFLKIDFVLYLSLLALSVSVLVFISCIGLRGALSPNINFHRLIKYFVALIPPGVGAFFESLTLIFPRFILADCCSSDAVGVYMIMMQISSGIGLFASVRLQSDLPVIRETIDSGKLKDVNNIIRSFGGWYIKLCSLFLLLVLVIPDRYFELIFGEWVGGYIGYFLFFPLISFFVFYSGYVVNCRSLILGGGVIIRSALISLVLSILFILLSSYLFGGHLLIVLFGILVAYFLKLSYGLFANK